MAKWQLFKYHLKQRVCMDWVDKPQNYKDLYGILQLLRGSHLNNFRLKTLKLSRVASHSVTIQQKCLDFQSNQYKKLAPVHSRFCNWLWLDLLTGIKFCHGDCRRTLHLALYIWNGTISPSVRFSQGSGGMGAACSSDSLKEIIFLHCSKFRCSIMFLVKVLFNSRDISLSLKSILEISLVCSLEVNYCVPLFPSLVRIQDI